MELNKNEMKKSFEFAKTLEDARHATYSKLQRLERLEHLEVVLRMWADNHEDTAENRRGVGYAQAQLEVFQILCESKDGPLPKFDKLINEFAIPEED